VRWAPSVDPVAYGADMASSNARGREPVLAYSGGTIDRAGNQRPDPAWVDAILAAEGARLIPMWRDRCLVSGEPAAPVILPVTEAEAILSVADPVFLGLDDDAGIFASDLSQLEETQAIRTAGGERTADVRGLVGTLGSSEAALLGYARGMLHWNRHQQYCGTCGSRTRSDQGGHLRTCENAACGCLHFPRVEPAVIMLVETRDTPSRCLLARHKGSAEGSYSTLAGFVDVSESLEDAVRREVAEETGVPVETVSYVASQGWPFPSGLMVGFRATAAGETVTVDGMEVIEARWFTRAELAEYRASRGHLGREDSIGRYLLHSWLEEAG
jgi:NAD+ diphosphatase